MIGAFAKAVGQLPEPEFRRVLAISVLGALAVFAILWGATGWALSATSISDYWWLEYIVDIGAWVAILVVTWLLFPAVIGLIVSFFLEDAAAAVEARHYPGLPPARGQSLGEIVAITVKFAILAVVLNIVFLPVVLILFVFPPLNLFVFYGLNGYLLGREYFDLVAHRRMDPIEAKVLRYAFRGRLFLAGVFVAVLMTVPFVNLVAPLIATAALVHLLEDWRGRMKGPDKG